MSTTDTDRKARKARERAEAAEKARAYRRAQSRKRVIIGVAIGLVVALLLSAAIVLIYKESTKTALSEYEGPVPTLADETGGLVLADGDGPRVDIYYDFMCSWCSQFEQANAEDIAALVGSDDTTLVIHPLNIMDYVSGGTRYSSRTANAFVTAVEADPATAMEFSRLLFVNQPAEGDAGLDSGEIAEIATLAGVAPEVIDTFEDGIYSGWVQAAADYAADEDGRDATPLVFIDGTYSGGNGEYMSPGVLIEAIDAAR